ncbi:hypothetical protein F4604DRAFT_1938847 [Suillus subluteus]|nr:hypothetical protein F4604DRAFT_1938847 [Suillus subluteus]
MVKNATFSLAKQQSLDPHAHFYLGDVGDDPLEILFGRTHMIGGHNSACSYAQAIDRLGAAKDIDGVFKHHPELDPGHQRLKLTRHEGVDHINCEIWKGDITAGRCDLPLAWRKGRNAALSILSMSQLDPVHYSFTEHFYSSAVDMMRPFGQNRYFGVCTDKEHMDPSQIPPPPPPIVILPAVQHLETTLGNETDGELQAECNDDEELMLTFQEALIDESPCDAPSVAPSNQLLTSSTPDLPHGSSVRPDDYLMYSGRWIHKQTVCRLVINKDFVSKSLNRLERVREGYTKVNKQIDMSAGRITDQNLFLVGDIFLTILRSGRTLSIGVLRSTSATLNSISHASINTTIMKALRSTAKITGQLLTLIPTDASPDASQYFLWDGGYVTARSIIQGSPDSMERIVIVSVPGALIEPVNPEATFIRFQDNVNSDAFTQVSGGQNTWKVPRDAMQAACDLLWAKAVELKLTLKSIASVTPSNVKSFPYQLSNGTVAVSSVEASGLLAASEGEHVTVCPLCEAKVPDMRCHMGQHILCTLCNTPEVIDMKEQVGETYPCGFCGRSGWSKCAITITVTTSGAPTWTTQCTYQHAFRYGAVDNGSKNKPCQNLPLKCTLCHPVLPPEPGRSSRKVPVLAVEAIWRYNMLEHIMKEHDEYSVPGRRSEGVELPAHVRNDMTLTELEQSTSHIPKERWITPPSVLSGSDKENVPVSSSRPPKRSLTASTGYKAAKRSRTFA